MNKEELTVGYMAKRCGVNVSTLHFYEEKGLIKSWRNQGNQRRYHRDTLRRISVIKAAQKVGITLDNIKKALDSLPENRTPTKEDWQLLASNWNEELNARIAYLENLRDSLTSCIGCGCLSLTQCPIYNDQDKLATEGTGPILLDRKVSMK